jgi:hypothetical protein
MFDNDLGLIEITWRRWAGSTKNAHRQVQNTYQDQTIMAGVDDLVSRENTATTGSEAQAIVQGVLFLPPGTEVDQRDQFVIGTKVYAVVHTPPVPMQSMFTGLQFRTEVQVKRVSG